MDFETTKAFEGVNNRLEAIDSKVDKKVDAVERKVDVLTSRVDAIDTKLDGLTSRVDAIDTKLDGLTSRVDAIDTKLEAHDQRFDKLEGDFGDLKVMLIHEFRRIDQRFVAMDRRIDEQGDKILDEMKRYMDILLERNASDMRAFTEKLSGQNGRVDDHETRIVRLEQKSA